MTTPAPGTEIAARQPNEPARQQVNLLEPLNDLDKAWRVATLLAGSTMVPDALRNKPGNCLIVMTTGAELGLTFTQAIRMIYVSKSGSPGLRGELLLVKLRQAGHDYTSELSDVGCVFTLHLNHTAEDDPKKRCVGGRHHEAEFNIDDAVTAGLCSIGENGRPRARSQQGNPLPWEQYSKDLFFWRACARAVRRGCPEVTYGFNLAGVETTDGPTEVAAEVTLLPAHTMPGEVIQPDPAQSDVDAQLAGISQQAAQAPPPPRAAPPAAPDTAPPVVPAVTGEALVDKADYPPAGYGYQEDSAHAVSSPVVPAVAEEGSPDYVDPDMLEDYASQTAPVDPVLEGPVVATETAAPAITPDAAPATRASKPGPASKASKDAIVAALIALGCTDSKAKLHTCSVIIRRWVNRPSEILGTDVPAILDTLIEITRYAAVNKLDAPKHLIEETERMRKLWEGDEPGAFAQGATDAQ